MRINTVYKQGVNDMACGLCCLASAAEALLGGTAESHAGSLRSHASRRHGTLAAAKFSDYGFLAAELRELASDLQLSVGEHAPAPFIDAGLWLLYVLMPFADPSKAKANEWWGHYVLATVTGQERMVASFTVYDPHPWHVERTEMAHEALAFYRHITDIQPTSKRRQVGQFFAAEIRATR